MNGNELLADVVERVSRPNRVDGMEEESISLRVTTNHPYIPQVMPGPLG